MYNKKYAHFYNGRIFSYIYYHLPKCRGVLAGQPIDDVQVLQWGHVNPWVRPTQVLALSSDMDLDIRIKSKSFWEELRKLFSVRLQFRLRTKKTVLCAYTRKVDATLLCTVPH